MIFKKILKPIINKTKNKLISDKYILCENFLSKSLGVMLKHNIEIPYVFVFDKETKEFFHTFFCLENIDIVFLDSEKRVVDIYRNVSPFRVIFPKAKYKYVIEIPSKFNERIDLNDVLDF